MYDVIQCNKLILKFPVNGVTDRSSMVDPWLSEPSIIQIEFQAQ